MYRRKLKYESRWIDCCSMGILFVIGTLASGGSAKLSIDFKGNLMELRARKIFINQKKKKFNSGCLEIPATASARCLSLSVDVGSWGHNVTVLGTPRQHTKELIGGPVGPRRGVSGRRLASPLPPRTLRGKNCNYCLPGGRIQHSSSMLWWLVELLEIRFVNVEKKLLLFLKCEKELKRELSFRECFLALFPIQLE